MGEGQAVSEMGHAPIGPVCPPDVPAPLPASRGVCLEGTVLSKWSSVYFILLCGITLPLSLSHVNRELHVLSWVCILQLCVVLSLQLVILQGPETSTCLDIQTGVQYYIQVRARPNGSVYAGYWSDWSPPLTVDTPSDIGKVTLLWRPFFISDYIKCLLYMGRWILLDNSNLFVFCDVQVGLERCNPWIVDITVTALLIRQAIVILKLWFFIWTQQGPSSSSAFLSWCSSYQLCSSQCSPGISGKMLFQCVPPTVNTRIF